jgi:hypothetical protein
MALVIDTPKVMYGYAEEESADNHPQSCDNEEGHGGVGAEEELSGSEDADEED